MEPVPEQGAGAGSKEEVKARVVSKEGMTVVHPDVLAADTTGDLPAWVTDLSRVSGIAGTLVSLAATFVGWLSGGPSNQDILNAVNNLSSQISQVESGVSQLIQDNYQTQLQFQNLSGQYILNSVQGEFSNYIDPGFTEINSYAVRGGDQSFVPFIDNNSRAASSFFAQSSWYYQLGTDAQFHFTPIFATTPYLRALQLRLLAIPIVNSRWVSDPTIKSELIGHQAFLDWLISSTRTWADAQCSHTVDHVCLEWDWIGDPKPRPICIQGYWEYSSHCPGGPVLTGTGYATQVLARNAGLAALQGPNGYPLVESEALIPQMQQVSGLLTTTINSMP
jgi:hypothetical protein